MDTEKVQGIRDLIRPILTLELATGYILAILTALCVALKVMWATNKFDLEVVVALIAILGTPFMMMMTYHFMKPTKKTP